MNIYRLTSDLKYVNPIGVTLNIEEKSVHSTNSIICSSRDSWIGVERGLPDFKFNHKSIILWKSAIINICREFKNDINRNDPYSLLCSLFEDKTHQHIDMNKY